MKIDEIVEDFFNNLVVQNHFFSKKHNQPIFLVGEKHLYEALMEAIQQAKYEAL